jgi:DeoR/GlpR family transcriptional regulator of sugar metabolism
MNNFPDGVSLQHERRNEIVKKIQQDNVLRVSDLVKEYTVSIETIRRDLKYLEEKGCLDRVYGGAILHGFYAEEAGLAHREVTNYREKQAIGKKAAEFIDDGDTLFIDLGTTTMETARQLRSKKNLTIITNALLIAQELINNSSDCRVIVLGGELRREEFSVFGTITTTNIENFYAAKVILGIGGISPKTGITDYNFGEALTRRMMIERAGMVIGVADYSKFGVTAMNSICPVEKLDILVTDWTIPEIVLSEYRSRNIAIYAAPEPDF